MPKLALALHTTTPQLQLALGSFCQGEDLTIVEKIADLGKKSSGLVHIYLQELMTDRSWTDLVYVAVATGVGSFTGTRVGVVIARTLGQQLHIPVYGVACAEIDARTGEGSAVRKLLEIAHQRWCHQEPGDYKDVLPLYQ
ncbi:MAG: tRNA (adenosine(37)-N6)-threonylcarbamoyltransferase complex dimerization subunit type 1 TsaB [Pseudanabaenaceae cyanobacterium SKYGB_i_bin29]|nr:tRNA (adenosine(37)-N6)-threonylcarbamoyltransferase complex dimerization subunit type 1 TsaB [Pseudanabaenaceae cyanobacterium SKYG29]MDW8420942.1 tRNA (adenosine(37)-N6)-threonylcarbamoyltransferase complex dimerization subunit type 1 TsaB [Pseudanabaenaceae cyanobacterium SKYGB_i_bin29]